MLDKMLGRILPNAVRGKLRDLLSFFRPAPSPRPDDSAIRPPAVAEPTAKRELPLVEKSDPFCILPWNYALILEEGFLKPCCEFKTPILKEGSPLSLHEHTLEEVWNSDHLRGVRRDMVQGRMAPGCVLCYQKEAEGGVSSRMNWNAGLITEPGLVETLKAQAVANDYRLADPSRLELHVGNRCNLKCRMCSDCSSSRIARDPIHSTWNKKGWELVERWAHGKPWFENKDLIENKLFKHPEQIKNIHFIGGEPFLVREIGDVLQHLIDRGTAGDTVLSMSTNATTTNAPWLKLTEQFKSFHLDISIDGFGRLFEYIRYPAKWDAVIRNLEVLRQLPKTDIDVNVTIQNYNVLQVVDLFRYLDSIGVIWHVYTLVMPTYLRATTLPPRARRLAMERLRSYADGDCRPENRHKVLGVIHELELAGDTFDVDLQRDFMLFTNDIDVSRQQSFRETHEELLGLIAEAGFAWTTETLHADSSGRCALPVV